MKRVIGKRVWRSIALTAAVLIVGAIAVNPSLAQLKPTVKTTVAPITFDPFHPTTTTKVTAPIFVGPLPFRTPPATQPTLTPSVPILTPPDDGGSTIAGPPVRDPFRPPVRSPIRP